MDVSINEAKQRVELYEVERVESWEELEEVAKRQRKEWAEVKRLEEVISIRLFSNKNSTGQKLENFQKLKPTPQRLNVPEPMRRFLPKTFKLP